MGIKDAFTKDSIREIITTRIKPAVKEKIGLSLTKSHPAPIKKIIPKTANTIDESGKLDQIFTIWNSSKPVFLSKNGDKYNAENAKASRKNMPAKEAYLKIPT